MQAKDKKREMYFFGFAHDRLRVQSLNGKNQISIKFLKKFVFSLQIKMENLKVV